MVKCVQKPKRKHWLACGIYLGPKYSVLVTKYFKVYRWDTAMIPVPVIVILVPISFGFEGIFIFSISA